MFPRLFVNKRWAWPGQQILGIVIRPSGVAFTIRARNLFFPRLVAFGRPLPSRHADYYNNILRTEYARVVARVTQ